jgi:hypothetical protein
MAVYKVIQDIEAEDKLLGPLTLKGFIYAGIAGSCAFIEFRLLFIGTPLKWLFLLIFAVPMLLFGVLASPLGREQPTEVWLLSRIRYFLKSRKRVWDQEGSDDLVIITAPKKQEIHLTKDLSPKEVQSRLKTLALTLDTRGWAIKNVDVDIGAQAAKEAEDQQSDRLIAASGVAQETPVVDVQAADDIMDEKHNPTAQKFEAMMQRAEAERKHGILSTLKELVDNDEVAEPKHHKKRQTHHLDTKDLPATKAALARRRRADAEARAKRKAEEEERVEKELAKARAKFATDFEEGHMKANPHHQLAGAPKQPTPPVATANSVTPEKQAANMELAQSGSAFSVATLSQLANRKANIEQTGPDEFTISLH